MLNYIYCGDGIQNANNQMFACATVPPPILSNLIADLKIVICDTCLGNVPTSAIASQ